MPRPLEEILADRIEAVDGKLPPTPHEKLLAILAPVCRLAEAADRYCRYVSLVETIRENDPRPGTMAWVRGADKAEQEMREARAALKAATPEWQP